MIRLRRAALTAAFLAAALARCRLEPPDPASQAAAILHKHPSAFADQLASLDALASREVAELEPGSLPPQLPLLAESLYAYACRLKPAMAAAAAAPDPDSARIAMLNAFVFDSLAIVPLDADTTLAASVPSLALARRKGSCVALVLVYLALGQALDLPLVPVFLPGHVCIRFRGHGRARYLETLRRGIARSDSFYRETFSLSQRPWYSLADAKPEQALAALVFNLGNARLSHGDLATAAEEFRLAGEALPGFPEALGNQGVCLWLQGDKAGAKAKFLAALEGDSLSPPALRNLVLFSGR